MTDLFKFKAAPEFVQSVEIRDGACNLVTIEVGEPDSDGFHMPVFTTHYDDNPLAEMESRRCGGCAYQKAERAEAYNYAYHRHVCDCEDSVCFECELDDGSDFACNRWTAPVETP